MTQDRLPLRDLEVEGYRGIRSLRLPELGRVNLFVGRNNAGKTSLLEAVQLVLEENPSALAAQVYDAIREHTDFSPRFLRVGRDSEVDSVEIEAAVSAVESLFFGGFDVQPKHPIRVGEMNGYRSVRIYGPRSHVGATVNLFDETEEEVFFGPNSRLFTVVTPTENRDIPLRLFLGRVPVRFRDRGDTLRVPAGGVSARDLREMWDRLAVSGEADLVEEAMRGIWPSFERALSAGDQSRRSVFIKLRGTARAVPLQSLGDGVQRVFSIGVALALASGGALVIDEVENGLHHTAQLEVWEAIFRLSERMNVQVFATTHSWEAVVAFQEAAGKSSAKGMLYRLEREENGEVYSERYTAKDLAVAAKHQVEVR